MKKILSLNILSIAIEKKWDFHQEISGRKYKLDLIILLGMPLIDIIKMINEGRLFYTPDF